MPTTPTIRKKVKFGDVEIDAVYRETRRPLPVEVRVDKEGENWDGLEKKSLEGAGFGFCPPLNPRTYEAEPGVTCEQDVAVTLRDGTVIYADIYRPDGRTGIPAIVSWSYFGKRPGDGFDEWQIIGVPPGTVSRMAKFESPDPGFWCREGYAVANVDPRGIGNSQGDVCMFGTQDARDGYDFIEWLAAQSWCNGKVGMGGNSGVAMTQWRIAAEQPPHLACIAPWEGTGDLYRESLRDGGIPALGFANFIVGSLVGQAYVDDMAAMALEHPFLDEYWADKIPQWEKIRIPVSTTVCWNHFHLRGSTEGFRRIRSTKKWLRCHREFEWPDTYSPFGLDDLKRFYDRYLKDIRNGWELTPRVRVEVMDAYECDFQTNRADKEFPLRRPQDPHLHRPVNRTGRTGVEDELRGRDGIHHVRRDVRRRHRDHGVHETPALGAGRRARRNGPLRGRPEARRSRQRASGARAGRAPPRRLGQDAGVAAGTGREALDQVPAGPIPPEGREARARGDRSRRHRDLAPQSHLAQGAAASRAGFRPLHPGRELVRALLLGVRQQGPARQPLGREVRLLPADPRDPPAVRGG